MECKKVNVPVHCISSAIITQSLENELILNFIFEKLEDISSTELELNRLVCREWNRVVANRIQIKNWKTRNVLNFSERNVLEEFLSVFSSPNANMIFPCFKIELGENEEDEKLVNKFMEVFFQKIKSLQLKLKFNSPLQLENILATQSLSLREFRIQIHGMNNMTKSFKNSNNFQLLNLNHLWLSVHPNCSGVRAQQLILRMLLSKFPTKKLIKICLMDWKNFEKTLAILQQYNQVQNLKAIGISALKSGELESLASAGVQLDFLDADTHFNNLSQMIYDFLETQVNNLKILSWGSPWVPKFPEEMPALIKLKLVNRRSGVFATKPKSEEEQLWVQTCRPIIYAQRFPNLEELQLRPKMGCHQLQPEFENYLLHPNNAFEPCSSLKKFGMTYPEIVMNMVQTISLAFPSLTSLDLGNCYTLEDDGNLYKSIWSAKFAPILQDLSIDLSISIITQRRRRRFELDSIFSGIDEETIKQISESWTAWDNFDSALDYGPDSILNLKNLKNLWLLRKNVRRWGGMNRQDGYFNDFSLLYVFGKMTSLEFFHLDNSIRNFSRFGVDYLITKFESMLKRVPKSQTHEDPFDMAFYSRNYDDGIINILDHFELKLPTIDPHVKEALGNEKILDHIFQYLGNSIVDLKRFRLVCKKWKPLASKWVQRFYCRVYYPVLNTVNLLEYYLKTFSATPKNELPYSVYQLKEIIESHGVCEQIERFVKTFSPGIKYLILNDTFTSRAQFENLLELVSDSLEMIEMQFHEKKTKKMENLDIPSSKDYELSRLTRIKLIYPGDEESEPEPRANSDSEGLNDQSYKILEIILSKLRVGNPLFLSMSGGSEVHRRTRYLASQYPGLNFIIKNPRKNKIA